MGLGPPIRVGREIRRVLAKTPPRAGSSNRLQNHDSLARVGQSNWTQLGVTENRGFRTASETEMANETPLRLCAQINEA